MASLGVASMVTRLDTSGLKAGFAQAERDADKSLTGIGAKITALGPKFTQVGKTLSLTITAPIVAMSAGIIKLSGDFEKSMNRVSALSGATGESLQRLSGLARQLGADTQFSASEAADAMSFLAMAGFEVDQIYSSMPGTLNLAAAAQLDMGSAADIVSNIMTGFGLSANELEGAVDVLSLAFISSNTDLRQLGDGMKFVGPIASGLGVSLEETTAALGALSNAGIQGGMAGTTLRNILGRLASESDKLGIATTDAAGNLRPLADIIDELNEKGMTTTETLEIFGDRGGPGMSALLSQGGASLRAFTEELNDAGGTAERVAETQMQGLHGMLKELQSAGEEFLLAMGDAGVLGMAKGVVTGLTNLIRKLNEMPESVRKVTIVVGGLAAATGPLLVGLGGVIAALPKMQAGFLLLRTSMLPFLGVTGILAASVTGYILLNNAMNAGRPERARASQDFRDLIQTMGAYRDQLVVTGEEERQQLIDSLNRRREALERIMQMQKTMIRSIEAEVIAFANMPWYKQIFNVGAANVNLDALQNAEAELNTITQELAGIDTQLSQVRTMEITPNVVIPPPLETGDEYDAFGIPTDGSTREVTVKVTEDYTRPLGGAHQRAMDRAEVMGPGAGMAGSLTASERAEWFQDVADRREELAAEARALQELNTEMGIRSSLHRQEIASIGRMNTLGSGFVGFLAGLADGVDDLTEDLQTARDRVTDARFGDSADEIERFTRNAGFMADTMKRAADEAARVASTTAHTGAMRAAAQGSTIGTGIVGVLGGLAAGVETVRSSAAAATIRVIAVSEAFRQGDASIEEVREAVFALRRVTPTTTEAVNELTGGIELFEKAMDAAARRTQERIQAFDEAPGSVDPSMFPRFLTPEQRAFGDSYQGFRRRETGETDKAFIEASRAAGGEIENAGLKFAEIAISAGTGFLNTVKSFQAGDIGGGIAGLGSTIGGAFTALGGLGGSLAALGPWGAVIGAGAGLLGGLVDLFSGGGSRDAESRRREEASRARSVPAISINFTVNQENTYNGAPSDPQNEQAFARQADQLFESIYRRHLGPRLDRIESRLGIAGA